MVSLDGITPRSSRRGSSAVPSAGMANFTLSWNHGMTLAAVLLVVGAALIIQADTGSRLHTIAFGILIAAAVVYLGARIWMVMRGTRR